MFCSILFYSIILYYMILYFLFIFIYIYTYYVYKSIYAYVYTYIQTQTHVSKGTFADTYTSSRYICKDIVVYFVYMSRGERKRSCKISCSPLHCMLVRAGLLRASVPV